ncbi:hypothetical protein N431DRAFT_37885 [Stipitochalara longipes BDJ]|nr:hypothetical protein N431DRAFT_37885 [Stipitochalara longipes BDJ]
MNITLAFERHWAALWGSNLIPISHQRAFKAIGVMGLVVDVSICQSAFNDFTWVWLLDAERNRLPFTLPHTSHSRLPYLQLVTSAQSAHLAGFPKPAAGTR